MLYYLVEIKKISLPYSAGYDIQVKYLNKAEPLDSFFSFSGLKICNLLMNIVMGYQNLAISIIGY